MVMRFDGTGIERDGVERMRGMMIRKRESYGEIVGREERVRRGNREILRMMK